MAPRNCLMRLGFSIDFEGFVEGMEESVAIPQRHPRFEIEGELSANCDRCLELLQRFGVRATFFVVGWIARRFPAIVRTIHEAGHEVGSHSMFHRRLWDLPEDTARQHVFESKAALEDVIGAKVAGFRAPDCALTDDGPVMGFLAEAGYLYDSSVNPTNIHDVYGAEVRRTGIYRTASGVIELPIPTVLLLGRYSITVGGGGYFRVFPFWLTRRWLASCEHPVTYLHPYEIGGVYPRDVRMSVTRRFRHTFGNGKLAPKLARLFASFSACSLGELLQESHGFG